LKKYDEALNKKTKKLVNNILAVGEATLKIFKNQTVKQKELEAQEIEAQNKVKKEEDDDTDVLGDISSIQDLSANENEQVNTKDKELIALDKKENRLTIKELKMTGED